jgi:acetyl-CoA C-acetyltransferase
MKRSREANEKGYLNKEIVNVEIKTKNGISTVDKDEELKKKVDETKLKKLNPVFKKNGSIFEDILKLGVTAGNASLISDGASALVLVSKKYALKHNLKVIAKILSFDDAAQEPMDFTTTPSIAVKKSLKSIHMSVDQIDYFEVNEAFSVVALSNAKILNVDINKVNVFGGAVSLGHPLGSSGIFIIFKKTLGSRIIGTLCNVLETKNAKIGCASICNGGIDFIFFNRKGGGGSAIIIERVGELKSKL